MLEAILEFVKKLSNVQAMSRKLDTGTFFEDLGPLSYKAQFLIFTMKQMVTVLVPF